MLLRAVEYGDVADVKMRMRSIVKRLMRGFWACRVHAKRIGSEEEALE